MPRAAARKAKQESLLEELQVTKKSLHKHKDAVDITDDKPSPNVSSNGGHPKMLYLLPTLIVRGVAGKYLYKIPLQKD